MKIDFNRALPLTLGIITFLLVCTPEILNPKNINWFSPWSNDPLATYLGWAFFRNSPWTLPLGLNPSYGMEFGSSIVFSDSIPLLAIPLKVISNYLTVPFQYLGIWILICFLFQAYFGWKIAKLITQNVTFCISLTLIFLFSPPFLHRVNLHASLVAHFLVLASLYLCLEKRARLQYLQWFFLLSISLLTQVYLFVMVGTLWVADLCTKGVFPRSTKTRILYMLYIPLTMLTLLCLMWLSGYFSNQGSEMGGGFGMFKLNLVSIIDSNHWSYLMPDITTPFDFQEGFNYLGFGLILLLPFASYSLVKNRNHCLTLLRNNKYLLFALFLLTIFSLSNSIGVGNWSISYPLPDYLLRLASIFRSSGRFFWPTYYLLIIGIFYLIWMGYSKKYAILLLTATCFIQLIDTSAGYWVTKSSQRFNMTSKLSDPRWDELAKHYKKIIVVPLGLNHDIDQPYWSDIALFAAHHQMGTNACYLSRSRNNEDFSKINNGYLNTVRSGQYSDDTVYVLNQNLSTLPIPFPSISSNKDALFRINGINLLLPKWHEKQSSSTFFAPKLNERILMNNQNAHLYLLDNIGNNSLDFGWSFPEQWGTWSNGISARLSLPILSGDVKHVDLEFRTHISSTHPQQRIIIKIEGKSVYESIIRSANTTRIRIPIPHLKDRLNLNLEFELPDAATPNKQDNRKIAIGLISATMYDK